MISIKYTYKDKEYVSTAEFSCFEEYNLFLEGMGDNIILISMVRS